ncbi:hypothetical protein SLEP1_g25980 [Rubroshorea leprosula]|uniref:Uncharacterized protein n=1 Tax=Rubroshorea leprosula TaxID=152421 RepID=A0AAV5JRR8_9ROSI|nr:hypothetical protein SLEP1_g25980 [Rubroshorea leprosula]
MGTRTKRSLVALIMVKTRSVRGGNSSQPLGRGQIPSNLPPHPPPPIPNIFPHVDHAEGGDENQPHNSAHNSASTANQDVVATQLAAMQQQFGVFQLVLAQLLARNNPGDPLINLLNPAPQPPAPPQNPEPIQHAPTVSESQGQSHIAPVQQPLHDDVTRRLDSLEKLVAEQRGAPPPHPIADSVPHPLNTNITLEPYPASFMLRGNQEVARHCYITSVTQPKKGKDQMPDAIPHQVHDNQQVIGVEIVDNRPEDETRAAPVEDVEEVQIDDRDPTRKTQIGTRLSPDERTELIAFLRANKDVFAWTSADMPGIHTSVSQHKLSTNPLKKPVAQKRRLFRGERLQVIKEEVEKLLQAGFVRRVDYCEWIANPVLVKKANGKWQICIDYTNLNQACPKDCYPMPNIDKLVEAASGNERLSLLDAYSGYHQVPMAPEDKEKTSFYAGDEIYCYVMMPFGLKNAVVKSLKAEDHLTDLEETFNNLRKNRMRLNPAKCIFGVESGKFLGFMVSRRGIEVNPKKIRAIVEMEPPKSVKDIQRLTGRVAALHRFISKSADKCLPFFKIMRLATQKDESGKQKKFEWTQECQVAFDELKSYLSLPPLLTKAKDGEILYLYLGISDEAISSVLVREEAKQQKPIYYISSVLHGAELRYPITEKAALVVVTSTRKLRPYFQSHPIIALTNQPLRQILQKPECFGRASSSKGSGADALLIGPDGYQSEHALKFNFDATNNMAEYETLLLGLQLALELKLSAIQVYSDSQLVVNQINSICEVIDPVMVKYVALVAELKCKFQKLCLSKIPRTENEQADSLSKFASDSSSHSRSVFVEILDEPSFMKPRVMEISTDPDSPSWTDPILSFLRDGIPAEELTTLVAPWPFAQWELDLLGPFVKGVGGVTHLVVGVDYFTKWVEARPLSSLTSKKVEDFVFSSIICRYGIQNQIVADNGTQFNCTSFRDFYSSYGIRLQFTSVYHPESNGMVESVNKCILEGETPYHLAFGTEAVIPIEIGVPSFRVTYFDEGRNGQLLRENLDLLDDVREEARLRTLVYKQKIANFYNKRVRPRTFNVGDLVLRKAGLTGFETRFGKLAPNWEGPYTVAKMPHPGAYILRDTEGKRVPRVWNVNNLKKFYP